MYESALKLNYNQVIFWASLFDESMQLILVMLAGWRIGSDWRGSIRGPLVYNDLGLLCESYWTVHLGVIYFIYTTFEIRLLKLYKNTTLK